MDGQPMFDILPLWITYAGIVLIILASAWSGSTLARWRKARLDIEEDAPIGTIVGATLALLAFILAFTFGLSSFLDFTLCVDHFGNV